MKVTRQVYIYFGSYFFNAVTSLLSVALLTKYLTPHDYGIINLYSSFLIFLMPFISGGILYPLSADFFKKKGDEYARHFSEAQAIPLVSLLIFSALCIAFCYPLSSFLRVTPLWVCLMPVSVWFLFINETSMMLARNKSQPWTFAGFSVGKNLTEMCLTIGLVIGMGLNWQGRLSSAVLASFLFIFVSGYFFYKWKVIVNKIDWKNVRNILWVSFPFIFERLSIFVLGYSDKYFIDKFDLKGTAEVGFYGLGGQIASIVQIVILSVTSAYNPAIFKWLSEKKFQKAFKLVKLYLFAIAAFILLFIIGLPIVYKFFISVEFSKGKYYSTYLIVAYGFWAIYSAFLPYFLFYNEGKKVLLISIFGMVLSLSLNAILVPRIGATGALYTSVAVYFTMAILSIFLSKPKWKLNEL